MLIRKTFKAEMAHIVRGAWSQRCAHSIHGHSYIFEIFFEGDTPDNGTMILDFGLAKKYMNDFLDSFDHACLLWDQDTELVDFFKDKFDRVITTPFSSSCEMQSKFIFHVCDEIIKKLPKENGEGEYRVAKVIVHETATGYAEYSLADVGNNNYPEVNIDDIHFSDGIKKEWAYNFLDLLRK